MPLTVPTNFKANLQGHDTNLVPIVIIGTEAGGIRISTNSLTYNGYQYRPVLLNIPSLKESIDIEKRNYKISSINLDISNMPYMGSRFSEIATDSLINTNVDIYWISQHSSTLDTDPDTDAMHIYKGFIRRYEHDDEKVRITVEDRSQAALHRDLPLASLGDDESVPDKYKNKPIPMVYGHVDRSPCVIKSTTYSETEYPTLVKVASDNQGNTYVNDDITIGNHTVPQSALYFFKNDNYYNVQQYVVSDPSLPDSEETEVSNFTYFPSDGYINFDISSEDNLSTNNALGIYLVRNFISLNDIGSPDGSLSGQTHDIFMNGYDGGDESTFPIGTSNALDGLSNTFCQIKGTLDIGSAPTSGYSYAFLDLQLEPISDLRTAQEYDEATDTIKDIPIQTYLIAKVVNNAGTSSVGGTTGYVKWGIWQPTSYINSAVNFTVSYSGQGFYAAPNYTGEFNISQDDYDSFASTDVPYLLTNYIRADQFPSIRIGIGSHYISSSSGEQMNVDLKIYHSLLYHNFKVKGIADKDFYANLRGRMTDPMPNAAIISILNTELGMLESLTGGTYTDWRCAFTVNKRINSKKLIENIASASPYIPRFDNMGNFKINVIPADGGVADHTIKKTDVLSFKYSRTKIEDVYTKVEFRYKWDYAREEFNKFVEMDLFDLDIVTGYSFNYYGLNGDNSDSTLSITDDRGKYIRNDDTARLLSIWLLSWHINQHLKIKLRLPLKYMNIEIGDLIAFDDILGNTNPYGINYVGDDIELNGQPIYKNFMVFSTNKTLEWVEIECIMMHKLYMTAEVYAVAEWGTPITLIDYNNALYFNFARVTDNVSWDQLLIDIPNINGITYYEDIADGGFEPPISALALNSGIWTGALVTAYPDGLEKDMACAITLDAGTGNTETSLFYNLATYNTGSIANIE